MVKPNNPSAFPIGKQIQICEQGMTLRDYFASKEMNRITIKSNSSGQQFDSHYDDWAKECYKRADAMLKQREL